MTDYHWPDLRERAVRAFNGETPHPATEQEIIDVFHEQPQLVAAAIDRVATNYAAGKVRSGWAVLKTHVHDAAQPQSTATATDTSERDKRIRQAEQWMRAAGIHYDRETEVEDELFGDRGLLRAWRTDRPLVERMLDLWAELRPTGVRVERQHLVHMGRRRIVAARAARLAKRHPEPVIDVPEPSLEPEIEPDPTAPEPSLA